MAHTHIQLEYWISVSLLFLIDLDFISKIWLLHY